MSTTRRESEEHSVSLSYTAVRRMRRYVNIVKGYMPFREGQDGWGALTGLDNIVRSLEEKNEYPYGICPWCNSKGVERERRPNGNDKCTQGHVYPSSKAVQV